MSSLESDETVKPIHWGKNLNMHFELLMEKMCSDVEPTRTKSFLGGCYLKNYKNIGEKQWNKFSDENTDLLQKIFVPLKKLRLISYEQEDYSEQYESIWEELNPLLMEASFKMTEYGLDVEAFQK